MIDDEFSHVFSPCGEMIAKRRESEGSVCIGGKNALQSQQKLHHPLKISLSRENGANITPEIVSRCKATLSRNPTFGELEVRCWSLEVIEIGWFGQERMRV